MVAQGNVKATDLATLLPVGMRIRYFLITTFCLNVFCAGVSLRLCHCPGLDLNADIHRHDLLEDLDSEPSQSS